MGTPPSRWLGPRDRQEGAGRGRAERGGAGRRGARAGPGAEGAGNPARGAGASGLLRWLSPARSGGFPGRTPDGGRGRGRTLGRGRGGAQLLLVQPGLHVSRGACPAGRWGRKVAIGGVVQLATCAGGAGLRPQRPRRTAGAARTGAGPRAAPSASLSSRRGLSTPIARCRPRARRARPGEKEGVSRGSGAEGG